MGYGFLNLTDDQKLIQKIKKFSKDQQKNKWENVVVLGIGGSALGGIALKDALLGSCHYLKKQPHLFFIDNIDPDLVNEVMSAIKIEKTLFIVISKSGGTTEPMALYSLFRERLIQKKTKDISRHFVFITDPKNGLLRPLGKKEGIEMFDISPKVGGRFSVLSSVGLVPASLAGIDINALMKGAKKMKAGEKKAKSKRSRSPGALRIGVLRSAVGRGTPRSDRPPGVDGGDDRVRPRASRQGPGQCFRTR